MDIRFKIHVIISIRWMNKHLVAITGQVLSSPWGVMRLLGDLHGYEVSTMPMIGLVCTEVKPGIRWPVSSVLSLYLYLHRSIHLFTILPQTCRREAHVYFHTGEKTMTTIDDYLECTWILWKRCKCFRILYLDKTVYIQKALEARLQVITTTATVCITMLELSLQNSLGKKRDLKIPKYIL